MSSAIKDTVDPRKNYFAWNTYSSVMFQVVTIVCGLILPKMIMSFYGSEVNGLINSISQLLQIVALLELGVGAVVQSSLYRPLAFNDVATVSKIIVSSNNFFMKIAKVLLFYTGVLIVCYSIFFSNEFGFGYTAFLIAAMSISSFAQYYFGIVDSILLNADQRSYFQYNITTITLIVNTVICCILIWSGFSIQIVKLVTSCIYLARPFFIRKYVNKTYAINRKMTYLEDPIPQKWNGIAQHVAAIVLDCTDTLVLTLFATLSTVSVYSIYFLVVSGVTRFIRSAFAGVQSMFGDLWAKNETNNLNQFFSRIEWLLHTSVILFWVCTYELIVPFVQVYTKSITDANYIAPVFAALICCAYAVYCLRFTYNTMILAAGHYKQTKNIFVIAAIINLTVSIIVVNFLGLVGVAIGTLLAMLYQTIHMAFYCIKYLIDHRIAIVIKQVLVDFLEVAAIIAIINILNLKMDNVSWLCWIILAIKIVIVSCLVVYLMNIIFYREMVVKLGLKIKAKFTNY